MTSQDAERTVGACDATGTSDTTGAARAINAVWRIESARIVAALARRFGDLDLAEELAQEALLAALEQWPSGGIPQNPGAWLMTAAKRRAIDGLRRRKLHEAREEQIGHELDLRHRIAQQDFEAAVDAALDDHFGDDLLRLLFTSCHPLLAPEARVALTLRLLGGLTTAEIARSFLLPEATIAQRIVRAKRVLAEARLPFEAPLGSELQNRLASVLEVIYLIFNEGYAATAGEDWMRPALCNEALRLGRILAGLLPQDAEVHGLLALMEIQASRAAARTDAEGRPVLLPEQDRARWDRLLIRRGLAALERSEQLTGPPGPYALQAAIAACHARASRAEATDWPRIAALYAQLAGRMPSPVVELNRAVAVAMAFGPAAGLAIVDGLRDEALLAHYHLLPSVRGDLLARLGREAEAAGEFKRAAAMTRNLRERQLLLRRALACSVRNAGARD